MGENFMKYTTAIFDLDGTLLDTLEDLTDSVNYVLEEQGFPTRSMKEIREFIGNGIRKLIERSVPNGTSSECVDLVYQNFKNYYRSHCMEKTKPYEGILELLEHLKQAGCKTAVVSNKADYAVQILCEKYFGNLLDAVLGEKSETPKKPAPDAVYKILEQLGESTENAVYIGDSDVDIITARNTGLDEIIVDWGFRDAEFLKSQNAKVIVSSPNEIEKFIL